MVSPPTKSSAVSSQSTRPSRRAMKPSRLAAMWIVTRESGLAIVWSRRQGAGRQHCGPVWSNLPNDTRVQRYAARRTEAAVGRLALDDAVSRLDLGHGGDASLAEDRLEDPPECLEGLGRIGDGDDIENVVGNVADVMPSNP